MIYALILKILLNLNLISFGEMKCINGKVSSDLFSLRVKSALHFKMLGNQTHC